MTLPPLRENITLSAACWAVQTVIGFRVSKYASVQSAPFAGLSLNQCYVVLCIKNYFMMSIYCLT